MPLAVRKGPRPDPGPTFRSDLHPGVLVATWCRTGGHFDVAGDPDSQLGDISVLATSSLLDSQVVVACRTEGQVEAGLVIAAVILGAHGGGHREVLGSEEISASHLGRIHTDLAGEHVDGPFEGEGRLGATGPPVGLGGSGVGDHRPGAVLNVGDVVGANGHRQGEYGQEGANSRVGARVDEHVESVVADIPVGGATDPETVHVGPAGSHGQHVFGAGLEPPDRAAHSGRQPGQEHVFWVGSQFGAESTTHVGCDHLDATGGPIPVEGLQDAPNAVGTLVGDPNHQLVAVPSGGR